MSTIPNHNHGARRGIPLHAPQGRPTSNPYLTNEGKRAEEKVAIVALGVITQAGRAQPQGGNVRLGGGHAHLPVQPLAVDRFTADRLVILQAPVLLPPQRGPTVPLARGGYNPHLAPPPGRGLPQGTAPVIYGRGAPLVLQLPDSQLPGPAPQQPSCGGVGLGRGHYHP